MSQPPPQGYPPQYGAPPQPFPGQAQPYAGQPQPYPAAYPPQQTTVVVTADPKYGHYNSNMVQVHTVHPIEMTCPHCHFTGMTHSDTHASG